MKDLTIIENVQELMSNSKCEEDWSNNCDLVKAANGGYPSWWWPEIICKDALSVAMASWELFTN